MPDYTQTERPLKITTPLGPDVLLLTGFKGFEKISRLFRIQADLLAVLATDIPFDQIIGQSVTIEMRLLDGDKRYFNGIVRRFSQSRRDETFNHFRAEIVPKAWLLRKKIRSRIFQQLSIPDILHQVLAGLDVSYELTGTYYPRDYCVQYRESDWDFASRLMEEEGIYYFFDHLDGSHPMTISDSPSKHPVVPGEATAIYDEVVGEERTDMRVLAWEKAQELRSGEYTLWDHSFELPGNHLEAQEKTIGSVAVGKVTHKLNVANSQLEIYDYPGRYAQRFDGVNPTGGSRPEDIKHIFEDRTRAVRLRMEQEETLGLRIIGKGDCGQFTAGHKFTLTRHFDADAPYLLTEIRHSARDQSYRSADPKNRPCLYRNSFVAIPETLRFRPQCVTKRPHIGGMQTATVVGPPGEELFIDRHGRVKVQFHWDREGKMDAKSSCWLRVAQVWAGKGWGAFFWPRIGHEVVVIFEEGDPDQPMIIGSVYNAENYPWYSLPKNKELGGIKSASVKGTAKSNFNGIVFNDEKGVEHLAIHSEHNLSLNSEQDKMINAGRHKGERVAVASTLTVGKLLPVGGGSGGGWGYDEGNPFPSPAPTGILGMNSVFTLGDNFQAAAPLNHQAVFGNNLQVCINPFGLAAGAPGANVPACLESICGSGMGGSMQFTMGTSAQFTLGQSYEISIGPPKIEIHSQYLQHGSVNLLCGLIGGATIVAMLAYDLLGLVNTGNNEKYQSAPVGPTGDAQRKAAADGERLGDYLRTGLVFAYQITTEILLAKVWAAEVAADSIDWFADGAMKQLYGVDQSALGKFGCPSVSDDPGDSPWSHCVPMSLGIIGISTILIAEMVTLSLEHSSDT